MKNVYWLITGILVIGSGLVLLIPSSIVVSGYSFVHAPDQSTVKGLRNTGGWGKWWPGDSRSDSVFIYGNDVYTIHRVNLNTVAIGIRKDNSSWEGSFGILNHGKDSSALTYEMILKSGNSFPFERVKNYFAARRVKADMKEIIGRFDTFLSNSSNIYGMAITVTKVKDSSYMSTAFTGKQKPGVAEIYTAIDRLNAYVASANGIVIGDPMLNIVRFPDSSYQAMIAVPVNRDLPGSGNIRLKKMVLGNILEAEINGGWASVAKAEQELRNFADDYRKESPAIPFQTLITNRLREKDTLKWRTKVSYPIF